MSDETLKLRWMKRVDTGRDVTIFRTWEKAIKHIADHLFSSPESEAWQSVFALNAIAPCIPVDVEKRRMLIKDAEASKGCSIQPQYDAYADAIERNVEDGQAMAWCVVTEEEASSKHKTQLLTFGLDGVLTVFAPWVRTALLPGQGSARAVADARDAGTPTENLARHRGGMRSGSNRGRDRKNRDQAPDRVSSKWSDDEQVFYRVFRPAVQFVRRCHPPAFTNEREGEYWRLKPVLPPMSQLSLAAWRGLRQRCRDKVDVQ